MKRVTRPAVFWPAIAIAIVAGTLALMGALDSLACTVFNIFARVLELWISGAVKQWLLSPKRAGLVVKNFRRGQPPPSKERFRFVLCWLKRDLSGSGADTVAEAFTDIGGVELTRSARVVEASGAKDAWQPAMRQRAREILDDWSADVAIVGLVKQPGEALSLWFVPREGDGTLDRGDMSYKLEGMRLEDEFREDTRMQILAIALSAAVSVASAEARGRVLADSMEDVAKKIGKLLDHGAITDPERRAALHAAHGMVLAVLGERKGGPKLLEQAIDALNAALEVRTHARAPLDWARTQHNLGVALQTLGELEGSAKRIEQAVAALNAALDVYAHARAPLDWAMTQSSLGNTLAALGRREGDPKLLEQAVAALNAALEVCTRERAPLDWARTQHNLGVALQTLGELEGSAKLHRAGHRRLQRGA